MATKDIFLKLSVNRNTDIRTLCKWLEIQIDDMRTHDTPKIYWIEVLKKQKVSKGVIKNENNTN